MPACSPLTTLEIELAITTSQKKQLMDRGKFIAILTGAISILIAIAYLMIVQILDFRGEMIPAPISQLFF